MSVLELLIAVQVREDNSLYGEEAERGELEKRNSCERKGREAVLRRITEWCAAVPVELEVTQSDQRTQ